MVAAAFLDTVVTKVKLNAERTFTDIASPFCLGELRPATRSKLKSFHHLPVTTRHNISKPQGQGHYDHNGASHRLRRKAQASSPSALLGISPANGTDQAPGMRQRSRSTEGIICTIVYFKLGVRIYGGSYNSPLYISNSAYVSTVEVIIHHCIFQTRRTYLRWKL